MADGVYAETYVKRKMAWWAVLAYVAMCLGIMIALSLIITGVYMLVGGVMIVIVGILFFITWRFLRVDYEYIFVTDELQVDKIYSGETRKKGPRVTIGDTERMEKTTREEMKKQKDGGAVIEDFTSREKNAEIYALRYSKNGEVHYLLLEPGEKLLATMARISPSKIKIG